MVAGDSDFVEDMRCPWCGKPVAFDRCELKDLAADGVSGDFVEECPHCGAPVLCDAWYELHVDVVGRG